MMKKTLSLLVFIFYLAVLHAQQADFTKANALYKQAKYEQAIELYEGLSKNYPLADEVYYNLGNCYMKTDKLGLAILNYERALSLNHRNEDAVHNLQIANAKQIDKIEANQTLFLFKWINNLKQSISANSFAVMCLLFLWLAVALLAISVFFIPKAKRLLTSILFIGLVLMGLLAGVVGFSQYQIEKNKKTAVLTALSSYVKSAPEDGSTDLFIIHEGLKLKITDQIGNYYRVELPDSKVGWINKEDVSLI